MSNIKLRTAAGGSITLTPENTASDVTLTVPGDNSTLVSATDLAASGGAAGVGYLPAGTGAVATTVQAKLRELPTVKDFGAKGDGVTDDSAAFAAMVAAGFFRVLAGDYMLKTPVSVDCNNAKNFYVESGVTFRTDQNITLFAFGNLNYNMDFNGARVNVDYASGYTATAITVRGKNYYLPDYTLMGLSDRLFFGNLNAYLTPVKANSTGTKSGSAFALLCNSTGTAYTDSNIILWTDFSFSAKGFKNAVVLKSEGCPYNFMSTCTVNVSTWYCDNAILDASGAGGSGIGDFTFNLRVQPDPTFEKVVRVNTGAGKISSSTFNYTLWDVQVISGTALIDATDTNKYSPTYLETDASVVSSYLNFVNTPALGPFKNYSSKFLDSDKTTTASEFNIAYLWMKGLDAATIGSITSGTNTLTLASASTFANGQTIIVAGAGVSGTPLHTTITSGGGTTSLVLAANASTTVSGVSVTYGPKTALQKIRDNVDAKKVRNNFSIEYIATQGAYSQSTLNFFAPFFRRYGVSGFGKWKIDVCVYSGVVQSISVTHTNLLVNSNPVFIYRSEYSKYYDSASSTFDVTPPDTNTNIALLSYKFDGMYLGQGPVWSTTTNKPLWYVGGGNWRFADGTIAI